MQLSPQVRRAREQRHLVLAGLVLVGFGMVALGLVWLQIAKNDYYVNLSKVNHVRLEVLRAPRGAIYDRNGRLLADSAPSFSVVFRPIPAESLKQADRMLNRAWIARVAGLVELDTAEVRRRVNEADARGQVAVLRHNAPFPMRAAVEESRDELPSIDVTMEPLRRYAFGTLAAHLLGYAGEVNDREVDSLATAGYRPGDLIGRTGIERSYEDVLRGKDGRENVVVNAAGQRVSTLQGDKPDPPTAGHSLVLTLDLPTQLALEDVMSDVDRGAAVAIDPRDGGILAMVSRPAFDPNEFSVGISHARWQELMGAGADPLLNRATQGVYPPGSTFKVVSMLAALRTGVANPETHMASTCVGHYVFGGRSFACWKHEGHGSLDLVSALQHSCDVYFYQLGLRLGLAPLDETARGFGFGDRTGIDLPQERKGLIPNAAWYDRRWGAGRWRKGLLLNLAIGQGELLVTPLQLALMMAEAASDGRPLRPHIVREVRGVPDFRADRPARPRLTASPADWDALHTALELVVDSGTGTAARVRGVRVAGKTGTAQNPHGRDHALFACYAPADAPRIAIAIVIENSGHGGSIAAPRAGRVLNTLLLPDSLRAGGRAAPIDTTKVDTTGAADAD
jgi:penicillin-binding protein 2